MNIYNIFNSCFTTSDVKIKINLSPMEFYKSFDKEDFYTIDINDRDVKEILNTWFIKNEKEWEPSRFLLRALMNLNGNEVYSLEDIFSVSFQYVNSSFSPYSFSKRRFRKNDKINRFLK